MNDKTSPGSFQFDLPEMSLQIFSFVELALVLVAAGLTYFLFRRITDILRNLGIVEKTSITYKLFNISSFLVPGFIVLYGLTSLSRGSFLMTLIISVVLSIVLGGALIDPIRAMLSALFIQLKGEIRVGDYITLTSVEGKVVGLGLFSLHIETNTGSRIYIPTYQILRQSYEVDNQSGGPAMAIELPGEQDKKRIEDLAILCPYRKENTKVESHHQEGNTIVHMEVSHLEAKPWVQQYFKNYLNGKSPRKKFF